MAQKRMIDKKISVSEQIADLQDSTVQLFFTWAIPQADDAGLLPRSARQLKAMIFPMKDDITPVMVEEIIKKLIGAKLCKEYEYNGIVYLQIINFYKFQTLKRDRMPQTLFQLPDKIKKPKDAWNHLETIGFQLEDIGNQMEAEVKRREEKRREENIDLPFGINKKKWEEWVSYLTEKKRKKPTNRTLKLHLGKLSKNITGHIEMIDRAIDRGWSSVFLPEKGFNGNSNYQKRVRGAEEDLDRKLTKEEDEARKKIEKQTAQLLGKITTI